MVCVLSTLFFSIDSHHGHTVNTFSSPQTRNAFLVPHMTALSDYGIINLLDVSSHTWVTSTRCLPFVGVSPLREGNGLFPGPRIRRYISGIFSRGRSYKYLRVMKVCLVFAICQCDVNTYDWTYGIVYFPFLLDIVVAVATHPQQNMIASASFNSDLSIRIWIDSGPPQPVGGPWIPSFLLLSFNLLYYDHPSFISQPPLEFLAISRMYSSCVLCYNLND